MSIEAMKLAIEALEIEQRAFAYDYGKVEQIKKAITSLRQDITKKPCNPHPDAPHGFTRGASMNSDEYVCECHSWTPIKQKSIVKEKK